MSEKSNEMHGRDAHATMKNMGGTPMLLRKYGSESKSNWFPRRDYRGLEEPLVCAQGFVWRVPHRRLQASRADRCAAESAAAVCGGERGDDRADARRGDDHAEDGAAGAGDRA